MAELFFLWPGDAKDRVQNWFERTINETNDVAGLSLTINWVERSREGGARGIMLCFGKIRQLLLVVEFAFVRCGFALHFCSCFHGGKLDGALARHGNF